MVLWNCGMLHKHYFMTTNNSGSYEALRIIKSCVSECKLFSGRLSRKFSPVFTSKCCANEILNNLLMSPMKQSSLFTMFHNLKFLFRFVLQKLSLAFVPQWSALCHLRRYKTAKCCSASDRRYGRKSRSVCILWRNSQPPPSINEKSSQWCMHYFLAGLGRYFLSFSRASKSVLHGIWAVFLDMSAELRCLHVRYQIDRVPCCKQQNHLIKFRRYWQIVVYYNTEIVVGHLHCY